MMGLRFYETFLDAREELHGWERNHEGHLVKVSGEPGLNVEHLCETCGAMFRMEAFRDSWRVATTPAVPQNPCACGSEVWRMDAAFRATGGPYRVALSEEPKYDFVCDSCGAAAPDVHG